MAVKSEEKMVRRSWELRSDTELGLEGWDRGQSLFLSLCPHPSVFFAGRM